MLRQVALKRAGFNPTRIGTKADGRLEQVGEGFKITTIELNTEGHVPGIDETAFLEQAQIAKRIVPSVEITMTAELIKAESA